jgi:multicomponent Na+:H+ antiporter subunit G
VTVATDILLAVGVLAAWLAAFVFARLRTSLERLHAVSVANIAVGVPITLAAILTDGVSARSLKCALLVFAIIFIGALLSQAIGRAVHLREGVRR